MPHEILEKIWDFAEQLNLLDYTNHKYYLNNVNNQFSKLFTPWDEEGYPLGRDLNEWPKPIWYKESIYIFEDRINNVSFTSKYKNYNDNKILSFVGYDKDRDNFLEYIDAPQFVNEGGIVKEEELEEV